MHINSAREMRAVGNSHGAEQQERFAERYGKPHLRTNYYLDQIIAICDEEWADGLTTANLRRLRARIVKRQKCDLAAADELNLAEALAVLEGNTLVSFETMNQLQSVWANAPYTTLDRFIDLGVDIAQADIQVVAGERPTICPNADPSLPAEVADKVLDTARRFPGLFPMKKGQTIHWVGRRAWERNRCTCSFPQTERLDAGRAGGTIEDEIPGTLAASGPPESANTSLSLDELDDTQRAGVELMFRREAFDRHHRLNSQEIADGLGTSSAEQVRQTFRRIVGKWLQSNQGRASGYWLTSDAAEFLRPIFTAKS